MIPLRPILSFWVLLAALNAPGAPVQIVVSTAGAAVTPALAVEVHLTGGPEGQPARNDLLRVEDGVLAIDLPAPAVWYLTPRAAGYYGETRALVTPHDGAPVQLKLWPAATLRAELPPKAPVKQVVARFEPVATDPATEGSSTFSPGASDCSVEGRRIECIVPAGRLDYSLRSFGYIPHYRWNQMVSAGTVVNLGRIEFRKGASLIGQVVTAAPLPRGTPVRVTLSPLVPSLHPEDAAHVRMATASSTADARGRFVFEGLQPGAYELSAVGGSLISDRREITIIDGLEAELREPLELAAPLTLTVQVDPPLDPWRRPWTVDLTRVDSRARMGTPAGNAPADAEGRWTKAGLIPGDYVLKIRRIQGVWHSRFTTLTDSTVIDITIPLLKVAGELRLDAERIPGSIWFGGEQGEISVPVKTSPDGTFRAILPEIEGNVWKRVDVAASEPAVRATLTDIRLPPPNDKGITTVSIVLPRTRLYGEVTTEDRQPVSNATVYAQPPGDGRPLQADVDEGGTFAFNGLAPGTYSVRAIGAPGKSDAMSVAVEVGDDTFLTIALKKDAEIGGTVVSRHGPVPGARVSIYPEDRSGFGILPWGRTDFEGRFRVPVERQSRNMTATVAAPGFAFRMFPLPAEPQQPLEVRVDQQGGRLVLEGDFSDAGHLFLFHGGAFVSIGSLETSGIAHRDRALVVMDNIEPGPYDVCRALPLEAALLARSTRPEGDCTRGHVVAGGTSLVKLRSPATRDAHQ